jgi:hypothetical protein
MPPHFEGMPAAALFQVISRRYLKTGSSDFSGDEGGE